MTIPSTLRKAGPLLGNGVQTAWPFTFKVFAGGDVKVVIADSAGTETVLTSNYSVALNPNQETSPGGTVTYPVSGAELPTGSVLSIVGDLEYDQPLDLPSGGNFSPLALENQLDRNTMQIQQLREELDRAARLPVTSVEDAESLVADIVRLADSADNLDSVAGSIASVNTVAANISDVNTVAASVGAVVATGANIDAVVAVGNDLLEPVSEVNTVAVAIANVNAVGNSIADVNTVAGVAANVTTVAGIAADVTIAADNVTDITNFADVYQGGKAADPTLRNDGGALQPGDLYFNTTTSRLRVFGGTVWQEGNAGSINVQNFSGTGAQAAFALATAPQAEENTQVYISGVYQQKDQYSISGVTLTFSSAPPAGTDNVEVVVMSVLALGTTDASLTNFTPAGTGAVVTTVQTKLRATVSVKDFGAIGDGVTDDTAAIQAAINYVATIGGGVSGGGGKYAVGSQITLGGAKRVRLIDITLIATGTWGTGIAGAVIRVINTSDNSTPQVANQHSLSNIKVLCQHLAGTGILLNSPGAGTNIDEFYIHGFTEYGLWCKATGDGANDCAISNGTIQEWTWSDGVSVNPEEYPGYSDYANRTAVGLYLDNVADMRFTGVVVNLCETQLKFNALCYSNKFFGCTFWANPSATGASTALLVDIPAGTSRGAQFIGCRFDDASLEIRQHDQLFDGCKFIQKANIIKLIATTADSTADGFQLLCCHFTTAAADSVKLNTEGAGTWVSRGLLKARIIGNWVEGNNTVTSGVNDVFGEKWIRNASSMVHGGLEYQSIGNRTHTFQSHSEVYGPGFGATKWGANNDFPSVMLAKSRSATVGTFGGYPASGNVLGYFGGTGDRGSDFGDATYTLTGAYMQMVADGAWSGSGYPTRIEWAVTPTTGVGNAVKGLTLSQFGLQITAKTVANLGSAATAGVGIKSFVTDATATTFASIVAGGGANNVPVYSDGTNWRVG